MFNRRIPMLAAAALVATTAAVGPPSLAGSEFLPGVGDSQYPRSRGKPQKRKRRSNRLIISKRVRLKHRKAAKR